MLLCADFHREYGLDLDGPPGTADILTARSWRWFLGRVLGLSDQSRWRHAVAGEPERSTPEQQLAEARARGRR
ncbi:hypothetical protein MXD62_16755 [Frankia sp. Mgl5]|uniref:hypothetical protein n=1 Tax=Frankia sp. Mgl5 TaxID=2933793 RepID=UPI00200C1C12|nr:hypothetical protein [Frankia sp. Mgl5]MCK9928807.1 hypothetical protein [Frankia sp. Mgl5]